MKSVKPGRGPSFMGGIGAVFMAFFGVIWTVMAANMGAPVFFVLFGVGFIILAVVWGVYHFHNAAGGNRFSAFDITEQGKSRIRWRSRGCKRRISLSAPPAARR